MAGKAKSTGGAPMTSRPQKARKRKPQAKVREKRGQDKLAKQESAGAVERTLRSMGFGKLLDSGTPQPR